LWRDYREKRAKKDEAVADSTTGQSASAETTRLD